jgi:hypothetical protein
MWPHVERLVNRTTSNSGDWTTEELRNAVCSGDQLLWITWDGSEIKAYCTTKIIPAPQGWICWVVACAGQDDDWPSRIKPIEEYAKDWGCKYMRIQGRNGWARVFRDYEFEWVSLAKRL